MKPPAWVIEDQDETLVQSEESIMRRLKDIAKFTQREIDIYAIKHCGITTFMYKIMIFRKILHILQIGIC